MARERIGNRHDAVEAQHHLHRPKRHTNNVSVRVDPVADRSVAGVGMDGFELEPEAMRSASARLAERRAELESHLGQAEELAGHLPDGGGPVAKQMRKAYLDRADQDNGVQAVLREYIAELDQIQTAIMMTLQAYDGMESHSVTEFGAAAAGEVE